MSGGFFPKPPVVLERRPLAVDGASALVFARDALEHHGFTVMVDGERLTATRRGMSSNKQPAIQAAGRVTVRVDGGDVEVASDLSGLVGMRILVFGMAPALGIVLAAATGAWWVLANAVLAPLVFGGLYWKLREDARAAVVYFADLVAAGRRRGGG